LNPSSKEKPIVNCRSLHSRWSIHVVASCFASLALAACVHTDLGADGSGGASAGSGGSRGSGGSNGSTGTGGVSAAGTGGVSAAGTGGVSAVGTGGATGSGGGRGGATGTGGGRGGTTGTGGTAAGTGGSDGGVSTDGGTVNCAAVLPTGGTVHTSMATQGTAAGQSWSIWSNTAPASITTYTSPAFSASWSNSGDFLARIGLQWGNTGKAVDSLGTVTAQYTETKTGQGGGYSYIGIYGWSVNPCIEWYIVDDSYNKMPVNPGSTTKKGTVTIDGGSYILYTRPTNGTGGSRCSGVNSWTQFYSVRQTARTCGQITISDHFSAWAANGMTLGSVLEASILVEVGGGVGSIDFPMASVTAQ
jgi:hypothetical protein